MEEKLSRMERLHFKKTLDKEAKRLFTLYTGYCLLGYFILGIIVTFTTYSLSSVVATVIFGSAYKDVLHGNISKINNYPEKLNRQYRRLEIILTKLAASLQTVIILIFSMEIALKELNNYYIGVIFFILIMAFSLLIKFPKRNKFYLWYNKN